MPRQLKPCGTYAAYARHLKHNEKPCDPCTEANRERAAAAPSGFNHYEWEMARALDARPPSITWRKNNRGVWIATSIQDPHAETSVEAQADRMRAAAVMAEREQARLYALEQERMRQQRADNSPLMTSARRTI